MLEVKSTWQYSFDENGKSFPILTLFMYRDDGEPYNCAMNASQCFNDGEDALRCLTTMITELVNGCYPEMQDPLYRLKKELKDIDERKAMLIKHIEMMEAARNEHSESS